MAIKFTVRLAEDSDIDAITDVLIKALPDDEQWAYRYTNWEEFPEQHLKNMTDRVKEWLSDAAYTVIVAADPESRKVIALSIWSVPTKDTEPHKKCSSTCLRTVQITLLTPLSLVKIPNMKAYHPKVNAARMLAYHKSCDRARAKFFDEYGVHQFRLAKLATHPDYRENGVGTKLVNWGQNEAEKYACPVTVLASLMGRSLYKRLGFSEMGIEKAEVKDEEESIKIYVLLWKPSSFV
jgi:ribosomal protein S18 acetylase RimI-like enzyme